MSASFSRAMHAIHADSLRPGMAILVVLMVVLIGWSAWLMFARVPFYETSRAATVTPDAVITAVFSPEALKQITSGQTGVFRPTIGGVTLITSPIPVTVSVVDTQRQEVWLTLPAHAKLPVGLTAGTMGEAQILVHQRSPLFLIMEAAGLIPAS